MGGGSSCESEREAQWRQLYERADDYGLASLTGKVKRIVLVFPPEIGCSTHHMRYVPGPATPHTAKQKAQRARHSPATMDANVPAVIPKSLQKLIWLSFK
jgi:hypothetical protein